MCEGEEKRGGAKWVRIFCDKVYNGTQWSTGPHPKRLLINFVMVTIIRLETIFWNPIHLVEPVNPMTRI